MTTAVILERRIDRGVEWLDGERGPLWVREIHTARLNLANPSRCVLGQLYGDFHLVVGPFYPVSRGRAISLGFHLRDPWFAGNVQANWALLTVLWRQRIEPLRQERVRWS